MIPTRFLAVALFLAGSLKAEVDFARLKFGAYISEVEKILGEADPRTSYSNPEVEFSFSYPHAWMEKELPVLPIVFFDRNLRCIAFEFRYINKTNGGNNPKSGRPWELPPLIGRKILSTFSKSSWEQLLPEGRDKIWKTADGKLYARVSNQTIFLAQSERMARLALRIVRF